MSRYTATARYSFGWTNPTAIFGSGTTSPQPFSTPPSSVSLHQTNEVAETVLEALWDMRFHDAPPSEDVLVKEDFYYALAYRWWCENKLRGVWIQTAPNATTLVYVRT